MPILNGRSWRRALAAAALLLVALWTGAGLAHRFYNAPAADDLTFTSDFESGDFEIWRQKGALHLCCDDSLVVVNQPVRMGRRAAQFTLRRNDPDVKGSRRAEIRIKAGHMGADYWHRFSILVPEDWQDDEALVTLAQWHAVPDKLLGEVGRSPPLRLAYQDGQWLLALIWDAKRVSQTRFSANDPDGWLLEQVGAVEKGRWTDWLFHIRWSYSDDGLVEVWQNGRLAFERSGPNAYNDALAPYLKLGIYVPAWAKEDSAGPDAYTIYVDEVRLSDQPTSAAEMMQGL